MVRRQAPRILVAALLLGPAVASAWNAVGHQLVAGIARQRLTPAVRAEAERLLRIGDDPRDLLSASTWADEIRNGRPETGNWHYTNIHFRTDGKPTSNKPEAMNVVVAIERQSAILKDRTKSDAQRGEALRWLIHLVGDVHQPLHAVARDSEAHPTGDRGGNDFKLGDRLNLHSLWDGGSFLLRAPKIDPLPQERDPNRDVLLGWADSLDRNVRIDRRVSEMRPDAWAQESFTVATSFAYKTPEGRVPDERYLAEGRRLAERRLVLGGRRLAILLNRLLGS